MPRSGVIFDLDGTLIDTLADIADAANHVLTTLGCPAHPTDAYRFFIGNGISKLIERALPQDRVQALHQEALEGLRDYYASNLIIKTTLYPGVQELLTELTEQNIPMAIVTNKPDILAKSAVTKLLDRWSFALVQGQAEGLAKKPDPAPALLASRAMDRPAERCFFVGDSGTDITTARNAKMVPIGAAWGFRPREELVESGASEIIEHPMQLIEIIDRAAKGPIQ